MIAAARLGAAAIENRVVSVQFEDVCLALSLTHGVLSSAQRVYVDVADELRVDGTSTGSRLGTTATQLPAEMKVPLVLQQLAVRSIMNIGLQNVLNRVGAGKTPAQMFNEFFERVHQQASLTYDTESLRFQQLLMRPRRESPWLPSLLQHTLASTRFDAKDIRLLQESKMVSALELNAKMN